MSTHVQALHRRDRGPTAVDRPAAYTARVIAAPADWDSPLDVLLEDASDRASLRETVTSWPRPGGTLPAAGQTCVVMFVNRQPVIIAWLQPGWGS